MDNVELQAARALLNKGVEVRVTAPLLLRLFGRETVRLIIKAPVRGTLYRCSEIFSATDLHGQELINFQPNDLHPITLKADKAMAKIIAMAWLNNYWSGLLFGGLVAKWLSWHLTNVQMLTAMQVIALLSGGPAFINTIRLAESMTVTAPNLSQETQGS